MFGGPYRPAGVLFLAVIAEEIQRKHSRTYVGSGEGLMRPDDQFSGLTDLTDPPGQEFSFFGAVTM